VADAEAYRFQLSPDGTRIRFNVWNEKDFSYSIWEIRTDGTNLHPLLGGGWWNRADVPKN
jgi:hypothetical protein